jgi:hypothetical protein
MPRHKDAEDDRPTVPVSKIVQGNDLFHRALNALGLHGAATMVMLADTLKAMGSSPDLMTLEELGMMLPELERRLLMLVPHEDCRVSMAKLRHMLITWEG